LICRKRRYLTALDSPEFESGYWTFYESEANRLVGGALYLHEKKSEPSYIGGTISGFRLASPEEPYPGKVVFRFTPEEICQNIVWEGDSHPMAWMGGILD
jgi:hypothetical protein